MFNPRMLSCRRQWKLPQPFDGPPTGTSHRLAVTDRAISTRERGRSHFPLREPSGLRPRGPAARTRWEREGNDPGASPCLKATDCARNPKTSRAALQVAVFAGRRSSPGIAGGHKPGGSAVESMRSYREIALDKHTYLVTTWPHAQVASDPGTFRIFSLMLLMARESRWSTAFRLIPRFLAKRSRIPGLDRSPSVNVYASITSCRSSSGRHSRQARTSSAVSTARSKFRADWSSGSPMRSTSAKREARGCRDRLP